MIIEILITIYLAANIFFAGMVMGDDGYKTLRHQLRMALIGILFGLPLCLFYLIEQAAKWLNAFFHIVFWFLFIFTKRFNNLDKDQLDRLDRRSKNAYGSPLRKFIFRKAVKCIFKRNNYKP